jgi:hypothetical protein
MMQSVEEIEMKLAQKRVFQQTQQLNYKKFATFSILSVISIIVLVMTVTATTVFPSIIRASSNQQWKQYLGYIGGNVLTADVLNSVNNVDNSSDASVTGPELIDARYCPFPHENKLKKSRLTMFLVSFFVGTLGIDRFMLGYIGHGIGKLLTCGGFGVWWLVDWVLICNYRMTDHQGCPLYEDLGVN